MFAFVCNILPSAGFVFTVSLSLSLDIFYTWCFSVNNLSALKQQNSCRLNVMEPKKCTYKNQPIYSCVIALIMFRDSRHSPRIMDDNGCTRDHLSWLRWIRISTVSRFGVRASVCLSVCPVFSCCSALFCPLDFRTYDMSNFYNLFHTYTIHTSISHLSPRWSWNVAGANIEFKTCRLYCISVSFRSIEHDEAPLTILKIEW